MHSINPFINTLWPKAVWDVSGAFSFDRELLSFYDFSKKQLGIERPIPIVHGSPLSSPWNSGRISPAFQCSNEEIDEAYNAYTQRRIDLYFTFSNYLIEKEHLSHRLSNSLCEVSNENNKLCKHAAIIGSDLLNEYIKKQYPRLRRINSILKIVHERGKGNLEVYKRFLDEFDEVMVHPDDVLDLDFLEKLPEKHRCILLINEHCIRNCGLRSLHYDDLSAESLNPSRNTNQELVARIKRNGCQDFHQMMMNEQKGVLTQSDEEVKKIYDLGFTHFKLQGRAMSNPMHQLSYLMRFIWRKDEGNDNSMRAIQQLFLEQLSFTA